MIHILYQFQDGPWGGGNQFLKSLRNALRKAGKYAERMEDARMILVNSHHFGSESDLLSLLKLLQNKPDIKIIHRIDGPVTLIRNRNEGTDHIIFRFNRIFADASIFQSRWCFDKCVELGWEDSNPHTTIFNAPDAAIFHRGEIRESGEKIRLIATSWSPSPGKGFDVYQWMDKNLDWDRYDMTFVGNSPVDFSNIRHIPPLSSADLAGQLRQHDIFVTASRNDPCSNSLIEALHCGLPALVYDDGGHPEIVRSGGLAFKKAEEIPDLLQRLSERMDDFRTAIDLPSMEEVTSTYIHFIESTEKIRTATQVDAKLFIEQYRHYKKKQETGLCRRILGKIKKALQKR